MAEYEREIDPAKKMFWDNMVENLKNSTSKKIYLEVQEVKKALAKTSKIDGWKFLRGICADVVGKIDRLNG